MAGRRGVTKLRRSPKQHRPDLGTLNGMLCETLRAVRLDAKLLQSDVGANVGWSSSRIPLLERGKHAVGINTLETWMHALGVYNVDITICYPGAGGEAKFRRVTMKPRSIQNDRTD